MKSIKLAGVVTLYNPTDEDINNISTYIDDIDRLYIVDNTEGHDNKSRIPDNKKIKYIFNNNNIGVAAALNMGALLAKEEGYKYLLTNDQDTTFNKGVLPKLKELIYNTDMTIIGIVTPWHNTKLLDEKPKEKYSDPHDVMTSGNIINLDIYDKIGGFKDFLFIDGIDLEYCMNLHKSGYKILRVNDLEIDHNLGDLCYKNFFGRPYYCSNHTAIRRYYIMRNYQYIYDMYKDYDLKFCKELAHQRHNIIGVILFEKDKIKKLKMYYRGYRDYKKGIKGKYPYKK